MLFRKQLTYLFSLVLIATSLVGCLRLTHPSKSRYLNPALESKSPRETPRQTSTSHHRVSKGETLYSIAFSYDRDVRDVASWNRIGKPYTIYPGQKLRVVPIASDDKHGNQGKKEVAIASQKSWKSHSKREQRSAGKLKWQWPTSGRVVSTFSYNDPGRRGIEIAGKKGQPVYAAAAGTVVYKGNGLRGYGNLIILKHNETYFSAYAHTDDVVVKEDEKVKLGQRLADMGNTSSNKTLLHFEIRRNGKPVNPTKYLPDRR